ncbi:MAG TPA: ankyrin repeat domain-containing protein [Gemmatimonadales bacterium]|nr:ankyrin repeat domain-containing protein [Hyphomicrobiaceae bacterium]HWC74459.1 ankyrin repeat domain-containing protein [Gemmatimonadales bacterium]
MFPNPQDALPLPSSPSIEQYKKLAKDLVKACAAGTREIARWADRWMASLLAGSDKRHIDRAAAGVEEFAIRALRRVDRSCVLADAQFVLAHSHGFTTWAAFVSHLEALAHTGTGAAAFEAAAEAIVRGDEQTLRELLRHKPDLIRARSTREHNATLLHYVSANGVESYRQKSPPNAARITKLLLDAGADVEAEANVYGGGCTALGLVATSTPPREAGVQIPVMEVLLEHGAQIEHPDLAGKGSDAVYACLANGCPEAAAYLADRGGRVGLIGAAGIGRLDVVQQLVDVAEAPRREMALRYAAGYGRLEIVKFLLDRGVNVDGHHNDGRTALFYAILGGHLEVVRLLLERGAKSDIMTENGPVFGAALWQAHRGDADAQVPIIEALIAAGGKPPARYPPVHDKIDALLASHGWPPDPTRYWPGEEPRSTRS